ncbi:hypothetical protein GCM10025872_38470 [Barrientosiimonas endolithica]|uniref:Uncharacterized protein n=1 Tax=Barrientosiimonas endolithica TaxID=1535208 RepID=A0ABM8HGN5_9MICO|nr:hypothetical protein GCM10025872_38470 [Barrientosiimonas endolithica]
MPAELVALDDDERGTVGPESSWQADSAVAVVRVSAITVAKRACERVIGSSRGTPDGRAGEVLPPTPVRRRRFLRPNPS